MDGCRVVKRGFLRDGEGFSTVGVVIALLITLSLVFTGAQVYHVQSAAAEVQEVADATALAAENVVAEYYLVARFCDAIILSLSLTGIVAMGVGVAALCTPVTAEVGGSLIKAGERVLRARDTFAQKAAAGLDRLQKALPFLGAAAAARVAGANGGRNGQGYLGIAVLAPLEGEPVGVGMTGAAEELIDDVESSGDDLKQAGEDAEDAAQKAQTSKERAYFHDCGAYPDYCLYERAETLAELSGGQNPYFSTVETWSFAAALNRAKAYYPERLAQEEPWGDTVEEQAKSALREDFFRYAVDTVGEGYVYESEDSFDADFPLLPKNTSEMKETSLYTDAEYPVTTGDEELFEMHAWEGCPRALEIIGYGSLAEYDEGPYTLCPECEFRPSSLGKIGAASSSIENGFEYHYRIIAEEAQRYHEAKKESAEKSRVVKDTAESLFDEALDALKNMASQRIEVAPPGRYGAVAIVMSRGNVAPAAVFASSFVDDGSVLGTRVAISASTLVSDSPEQGRTIISTALDGLREDAPSSLVGALDGVMDVWSSVLYAYADGQERVSQGLDDIASKFSFGSASGLGVWGSERFSDVMEGLGLQPAKLDAPKPVVVNTGRVLQADSESGFSARLLSVKRAAAGLSGNDVLGGSVNAAERWLLGGIEGLGSEMTIAEVEILGEGGPSIPLTIALPPAARDMGTDVVAEAAEALRDVAGSVTGVRQWR